jgi:hypothetical protein
MTIRFGEQYKLVIASGHVLWLSDYLEEWLIMLSEKDFDLNRECLAMAQSIIFELAHRSDLITETPENEEN